MTKKIIIIGAGPGGYVSSIRAAQLGADVTLIERGAIGGTCLNVGCIPTKALLHTTEELQQLKGDHYPGLVVSEARLDWAALLAHKDSTVHTLTSGVQNLLQANGVEVIAGDAVLCGEKAVLVDGETIEGDIIVLATGSSPSKPPIPGLDYEGVIDSTDGLSLAEIPSSMAILGGGVIGVEMASIYSAAGTAVTIVEMESEILPTVEPRMAKVLKKALQKRGITFMTSTALVEVEKEEGGLRLSLEKKGKPSEMRCEKLLVAVGRRPNIEGLGLEKVGIATERGAICVDDNYETSVPGVYAIGDCNGKIMLAHAASEQGVDVVEYALGYIDAVVAKPVAACIYTSPQIGAVGLTEGEVKARGTAYSVGSFPLRGNGKALIEGGEEGLMKVIVDDETQLILGAHMVGPEATELITEMALAMSTGRTVDEVIATIHPHPTIGEGWKEAALDAQGRAIHWLSKKR